MPERSQVLARNLASLPEERGRKNRRARTFKSDRTLQMLVADLVAARTAAGMTQEEVAVRMWTTKSVVTSGERYVHPPDIDHHREICGGGGRVRRNPRADEAVAFALQTSHGIVRPLRVVSGRQRTTSARSVAFHEPRIPR